MCENAKIQLIQTPYTLERIQMSTDQVSDPASDQFSDPVSDPVWICVHFCWRLHWNRFNSDYIHTRTDPTRSTIQILSFWRQQYHAIHGPIKRIFHVSYLKCTCFDRFRFKPLTKIGTDPDEYALGSDPKQIQIADPNGDGYGQRIKMWTIQQLQCKRKAYLYQFGQGSIWILAGVNGSQSIIHRIWKTRWGQSLLKLIFFA